MSESDKCDCKGVKAGKKKKGSGCPEIPKGDSNKCCGGLSKKEEKPKCGGASACAQSQNKEQCSGKSGFGKDKSKCPGKEEQKCHSSQEQFKKSQDKCPSDVKCSKSYTAFLESREESACPRKDGKCHESYTAFFSKKGSDNSPCSAAPKQQEELCPCPNKAQSESSCGSAYKKAFEQQEDPCSKPKSESPCSSAYEKALKNQEDPCSKPKSESPCSSAYEKALKQQKQDLVKQKDPCFRLKKTPPVQKPCTLETKKNPCFSSSKKATRSERPCGSQVEDSKGASAYEKLSGYCKNLAKKYVNPKTKSKCSGDEQLTKQICPVKPSSKPPCPPMTELGMPSQTGVECTSKVTCPQIKKSDPSAFFPLDARNKELNDCIEKWTKMDPKQVIGKCSQFADKPGGSLCQKCLDAVRKTSHCPRSSRKEITKRPSLMIPAKARQLASRWTPSAIGYIATSALLTVYVTEWKAILRHVPFYSSQIAEEEAASQ
ncbi:hypothetical protein J6590_049960 [Homalodisca vitripennis]|nr:hypothetical protein J6590_049960 [Homalodisca vitripennis]